MTQSFDDETLMAFADGQLEEPLFSQVADAVEADPAIAARVEQLALGGRLARAVYEPLAARPVPLHLARHIRRLEADATPGRDPRQRQRGWLPLAMAASVALVVAAPAGYWFGLQGSSPVTLGAPLGFAVARVLDTTPSGASAAVDGLTIRPVATFSTTTADLCREFEADGAARTVAVACRTGDGWQVAFAVADAAGGDGYAPASSLETLELYLTSVEATPPLSVADEARLLGF